MGDQHLNLLDNSWWTAADVNGTIEWFKKIDSIIGADGVNSDVINIGEISGSHNVDLNTVSKDMLSAVIASNSNITFSNVPDILYLELKTIIKNNNTTLSVEGISLQEVTEAGQSYVWIIKTLDGGASWEITFHLSDAPPLAPTVPKNIVAVEWSDNHMKIEWNMPDKGSLPILYDVVYSKASSENSEGGPDDADVVYFSDELNLEKEITGLDSGDTYYIWVRCKNSLGYSDWVGPLQVNIDGAYSAVDVNFVINSAGFNTVAASWSQPPGKALKFQLCKMVNGEFDPFFDSSNSKLSYTDINLNAGTSYDYALRIYNEFGILISTLLETITTDELPVPGISLNPQGNTINATLTIPVGILNIEYEHNIESDFLGHGLKCIIVSRLLPYNLTTTFQITKNDPHPTNTTMYYRTRCMYGLDFGPWSDVKSALTGQFLPPSKPTITGLTSPGIGQVRLKARFEDDDWRNEKIQVYRRRTSSDPFVYFDFIPRRTDTRDLDDRDERIEIIYTDVESGSWEFGITAINDSSPINQQFDSDTVFVT